MALVNYIDEYLTGHNKVPVTANIHKRIGGVLLISTLMSFVGALVISFIVDVTTVHPTAQALALLSSVPMVVMYAAYFYLLISYPVHKVEPLFQLSSIWLLIIEVILGQHVSLVALLGIALLVLGAYLLDAGTFKIQVPTKLLLIMLPATTTWSLSLILVRQAAQFSSPDVITFWQYLGIGVIGLLLLVLVKKYREGLFFRIKHQGKNFLGLSFINESLAETSYFFNNFAVAIAPVATFVTAMAGVQHLFVLLLFFLFPLSARSKITRMQLLAIVLIIVGVIVVESVV